jgi:Tfp pilus assembly protein PilF
MRRHRRWGLLLGLLPLVGCAAAQPGEWDAKFQMPAMQGSFASAATTAAPDKSELPPAQAAEACLATARQLEKNGFEAQAILQYEKARHYNSKAPVARRLAVLYDRQGDHQRALHEYNQALQAQPKDADLLNDIGYYYYQRQDWPRAEKHFRQALDSNPKHPRAWVNLGLTLGQQEHYEASYEAFAKAITPAEAHCNVGVLLAQHGKDDQAKMAFRKALDLEPNLKQAQAVLSRLDGPAPVATPPEEGKPTDRRKSAKAGSSSPTVTRAQDSLSRAREPARPDYTLRQGDAGRSLPATKPLVVPTAREVPPLVSSTGAPASISFE